MEKRSNYEIKFSGLSIGEHRYQFHVSQEFFDDLSVMQDFSGPDINIDATLNKGITTMDLDLKLSGKVELVCDRSGESFDQDLNGTLKMVIKFGEVFDDSDDEILVLEHGAHKLDATQMIYELITLSIPMKRYHPDYRPASDEEDEVLHFTQGEEGQKETDPRWEALKKLKDKN